jgi:hypothetical protein
MNIKNLIVVAGAVVTGYTCFHRKSVRVSNEELMELAKDELIKTHPEFDEDILEKSRAVNDALAKYNVLKNAENAKRKTMMSSEEYLTARTNKDAAESVFAAAKKAVKEYQPDSTSVAVGSGDSAVAISVTNTGKKLELDTELAKAQSEFDKAQNMLTNLNNKINSQIISERSVEDYETVSNYESAKRALDVSCAAKVAEERKLVNDTNWRYDAIAKTYASRVTKSDIIGDAIGYSALPAAILAGIWIDAATKISILNKVKEVV